MKLAIFAALMCAALLIAGLQPLPERPDNQPPAPSTSLAEWRGLKVIVYFHAECNPRAGVQAFHANTSPAGLHTVDSLPLTAAGILTSISDHAIVVNGGNGYVWIPRDQVRCIEAMQDAPSK